MSKEKASTPFYKKTWVKVTAILGLAGIGTGFLVRPTSDGLDFAAREGKIPRLASRTGEELQTLPSKTERKWVKIVDKVKLSPLASIIANETELVLIEENPDKVFAKAKAQFSKFKTVLSQEYGKQGKKLTDAEFEKIMREAGCMVDMENGTLTTPITLSGQTFTYEMVLRGQSIGFIEFMDRAKQELSGSVSAGNSLELENSFGVKLSENAIQISDVSFNLGSLAWALNTDLIKGDIEASVKSGAFTYVATLGQLIMEDPQIIGRNKVDEFIFVVPKPDVDLLTRVGLMDEQTVKLESSRKGEYYGMPLSELVLAKYDEKLVQQAAERAGKLQEKQVEQSNGR